MNVKITVSLLILLGFAGTAGAGPREDLLAGYAAEVKTAQPDFSGFSAARGEQMHRRNFAGGKADTPACASCHAADPRSAGRTPLGKDIAPMAVSVSPDRFTDPAKVEKWFRRNCKEVIGRACSPLEKGDWLSYMMSR